LELLPPRVRDRELLGLLGDVLSPRIEPTSASALRLRLMRDGFSWQALVDLASGQDVLLPLIFSLSARAARPRAPPPRARRANSRAPAPWRACAAARDWDGREAGGRNAWRQAGDRRLSWRTFFRVMPGIHETGGKRVDAWLAAVRVRREVPFPWTGRVLIARRQNSMRDACDSSPRAFWTRSPRCVELAVREGRCDCAD
jgi:hypothetical protein